MEEKIRELIGHPQIEKSSNLYTDNRGEKWASANYIIKTMGLNPKKIQERVRSLMGIAKNGVIISLFNISDVQEELNSRLSLPRVDKESVYIENSGEELAPISFFEEHYGFSSTFLSRRLKSLSAKEGIGKRGKRTYLYKISDVLKELGQIPILPQVNKSNILVDSVGEEWATQRHAGNLLRVSGDVIRSIQGNVRTILGRGSQGQTRELLNIKDIRRELYELRSLPLLDKQNSIYKDNQNQEWGHLVFFRNKYAIPNNQLRYYVEQSSSIIARNTRGARLTLHNVGEVSALIDDVLKSPRVDHETNIYTDPNGHEWTPLTFFNRRVGNLIKMFGSKIEHVNYIMGRGKNGFLTKLYDLKEISEIIRPFISLPMVSRNTSIYVDNDRKEWVTKQQLSKETGFAVETVYRYLDNVEFINGRNVAGRITILYNRTEAIEVLKKSNIRPSTRVKNETNISPEQANEQLRSLLE